MLESKVGGDRDTCTELDLGTEKNIVPQKMCFVLFYTYFKRYSIQKWKLPVQTNQPLGVSKGYRLLICKPELCQKP